MERLGEEETGRLGDGETKRLGDWGTGGLGDGGNFFVYNKKIKWIYNYSNTELKFISPIIGLIFVTLSFAN